MRSYIAYPNCCPWGWALPLEVGALLSGYYKVGNDGSEAAWSTAYDTRIDWRRIVRRCLVRSMGPWTCRIQCNVRMIGLLVLFPEQVRNTSLYTSNSLTLSQWCHQVIYLSITCQGNHNSFLLYALNSFSYGHGLEIVHRTRIYMVFRYLVKVVMPFKSLPPHLTRRGDEGRLSTELVCTTRVPARPLTPSPVAVYGYHFSHSPHICRGGLDTN